ncbi:Putative aminopeptidase [Candidatus Phytoplasma mali]|uniref:Probable cytosol aminopeptidase n=1 Tax=Phytoplasma mali (strain AT) TaxID=482235 RepID=AMPA_PHYMT|nr:leucyl aminopeptidase [Candidatus Phytoplasma mali]B3R0N4.1 RecName: Full=Probable cytosol aminopeptidase; AltName: Full=Leucine aminopeptidase; Short=LAP; AltName: Full=Leucyl aminopeptidase [Candidatus Phytoplasma mali AT]CAP18618.1 Putative aminopeptidase [Candidatus Phytoplasma mali]
MNVSFITQYTSSIDADAAILLQVEKFEKTFGLELVDPNRIIKKGYLIENFQGSFGSQIKFLYLEGSPFAFVKVVGLGKEQSINDETWLKAGGLCVSEIKNYPKKVVVFADALGIDVSTTQIMNFVLGALLKQYSFECYYTDKKKSKQKNKNILELVIITKNAENCQKELKQVQAICEGVNLTKELVNEPANILGTEEFVEKIKKLEKLNVKVQVLDKEKLKELGMNALLSVAQGSSRPPYLVIMQWNGSDNKEEEPLAFVGKGVVFDSGGISIKHSSGMEDMKADMGGAGTVVGLMHTLATRKAKINVTGVVGLVENMPSCHAQRPGDIVTSMSGQTIEVINTDAEGRMVLADVLWYCKTKIQPKLIVDLATLTGAIRIALGEQHAGLFSNNEALAKQIIKSGEATSEKVWQLPLGLEYDKLIDSKFADMKNSSGGSAGSITAAQFLKRFVDEKTPWAHIDIAAVCMGNKLNEFNNSWASGFGVRLLNYLIKNYYEQK